MITTKIKNSAELAWDQICIFLPKESILEVRLCGVEVSGKLDGHYSSNAKLYLNLGNYILLWLRLT